MENFDVLRGAAATGVCNHRQLADLGRLAVGNRGIGEFCTEVGLSRSFVSRLLNGKLPATPSVRSLYRFAGDGSNPQNGVTAEVMLLAAGYPRDFIKRPERATQAAEVGGKLSLSDSITLYYAQSPTAGLTVLLNALIENGYGTEYSIEYQPGRFRLKTTESGQTVVGIPAFCESEQGTAAVMLSVCERLVMALNLNTTETVYFIITDQRELYNALASDLPAIPTMKLAVLLTEDYQNVSQQAVIRPKGNGFSEEEGAEFPMILTK